VSWRELVVPSDPKRRKRIKRGQRVAFKLTRQERDLIVERMFVDAEIEGRLRNARSSNIEDTFTDEDDGTADAVMQEAKAFTPRQGQYLAFIYYYTKIHGRAPAEADPPCANNL
jgi:DNA/RNA endonuclease YhcR with UshA esterase domain